MTATRSNEMQSFKYLKTSEEEIIRWAVMMYFRFPKSLRNVEVFLQEGRLEVSHRRRPLDAMFVKVN